jgi:hypothetical protein
MLVRIMKQPHFVNKSEVLPVALRCHGGAR